MKLPASAETREFFTVVDPAAVPTIDMSESPSSNPLSVVDRMIWYFDRFWGEVADQAGFTAPTHFAEDSDLYVAYMTAHSQLMSDIRAVRRV